MNNFSTNPGGKGINIKTEHDITADPLFIVDELHVEAGSPVMDRGAGSAILQGISNTVKEGVTWLQNKTYDIEAYKRLQDSSIHHITIKNPASGFFLRSLIFSIIWKRPL